jgi:hypothetical protein
MKTLFSLSGRQQKELVDRGRPLRVAIPAPDIADYDPAGYFTSAVAGVPNDWIVSAEEITLPIRPTRKPQSGTLKELIGDVIHAHESPAPFPLLVVCVVAELQATRVGRQAVALTQWAGGPIAWPEWHQNSYQNSHQNS